MPICCLNVRHSLFGNGAGAIALGLWFIAWTVICFMFERTSLAWQLDEGVVVGERTSDANIFTGVEANAKAKRPKDFAFRPGVPWLGGLVERWPNALEPHHLLLTPHGESKETDESGDRWKKGAKKWTDSEMRKDFARTMDEWKSRVMLDMIVVAAIRVVISLMMIAGGALAIIIALKCSWNFPSTGNTITDERCQSYAVASLEGACQLLVIHIGTTVVFGFYQLFLWTCVTEAEGSLRVGVITIWEFQYLMWSIICLYMFFVGLWASAEATALKELLPKKKPKLQTVDEEAPDHESDESTTRKTASSDRPEAILAFQPSEEKSPSGSGVEKRPS